MSQSLSSLTSLAELSPKSPNLSPIKDITNTIQQNDHLDGNETESTVKSNGSHSKSTHSKPKEASSTKKTANNDKKRASLKRSIIDVDNGHDEENDKYEVESLVSNTQNNSMSIGSPSARSESSEKSKKSQSSRKVQSPGTKKLKLDSTVKEITENLDKLRKDFSRTKSRQRELENPKFPVKDDLLLTMELKGGALRPLPALNGGLNIPQELVTDALTIWDFITTFRNQLSLNPMTINDFLDLMQFTDRPSVALTEVICALLRLLLSDSNTSSKLSSWIPRKVNFAYQPKSIPIHDDNDDHHHKDATVHDVTIDNLEYDTLTNSLKLLPSRLNIHLINGIRYQPILRAILMRIDPVQRLRKAVAQLEYAQISFGKSHDRRLSRRFSLNQTSSSSKDMDIMDSGRIQYLRDKDVVLHITADPMKQLQVIHQAALELDHHELHELVISHKLAILRILCDACLDTDTMRSVLEKNEQDRTAKITAINKQIRDDKAAVKEDTASRRDAAIEACRKANIAAAKALTTKQSKSKSGRVTSTSVKAKSSKTKSIEPTSSQIQAMLEDMMMLEAYGIDEIIPAVEIDIPSDDEGDALSDRRSSSSSTSSSSSRRLSSIEKQKVRQDAINRLKLVEDANDLLTAALQSESDRDIKQAIKLSIRAGLRYEDRRGRVIITDLMKQVYKLQYDLEIQAKDDKLQSQLEKALIEYPVRTLPLGCDRYGREYYAFGDEMRLFVHNIIKHDHNKDDDDNDMELKMIQEKILTSMDDTCRILYQSRPSRISNEWGYYSSTATLWELYQALDDRGEKEKALRIAIQSRYELEEPKVVYLPDGSDYIGMKVRRQFKNKRMVVGTIVGWVPVQGDDVALWHVLHEDGDEEDLEEEEVKSSLCQDTLSVNAVDDVIKSSSKTSSKQSKLSSSTPMEIDDEVDDHVQPLTSFKPSMKDDVEEAEFDEENPIPGPLPSSSDNDDDETPSEPFIITSYSNYSYRHQQAIKAVQIGFEGLQSELLRIQSIVIEGMRNMSAASLYTRDQRKAWETAVRDAESYDELASAILELEETMHQAQDVDDKKEEDEIMKEKEQVKKLLQEEGWIFDMDVNEHVGKYARRFFSGYGLSDGKIIAYMPPESNEGEPLWRLEHFDGDQEDLDSEDLITALRHYDSNCKEDDNRMAGDDDHDSDDEDGSDNYDSDDDNRRISNNDSNKYKQSSTLWPTSGVRSRWIAAIQRSHTIGELAIGLSSLLEYGKSFGTVGEDPLELAKGSQTKSLWTKSSSSTSSAAVITSAVASPKHKSASRSSRREKTEYYDDYKRPSRLASREASKRIKDQYY